MVKKSSGWDDETDGKAPQQIACANGYFGCGQKFMVMGFDKDAQMIEVKGYDPRIRLCLPCANRVAHRRGIPFEDLDYLMTALSCVVGSKGKMDAADRTAVRERIAFMQKAGKDQDFKHKAVEQVQRFLNREAIA